jgi:hypothetical protein
METAAGINGQGVCLQGFSTTVRIRKTRRQARLSGPAQGRHRQQLVRWLPPRSGFES